MEGLGGQLVTLRPPLVAHCHAAVAPPSTPLSTPMRRTWTRAHCKGPSSTATRTVLCCPCACHGHPVVSWEGVHVQRAAMTVAVSVPIGREGLTVAVAAVVDC